jgi:class 3 adenylate cyclase
MSVIDVRLRGTRTQQIWNEFFTSTAHFPIADILLESLQGTLTLQHSTVYVLLLSSLVQAYFLGSWQYQERPHPLLGNLIAPTLYTLSEFSFHGVAFFAEPQHVLFWAFSLLIGMLQHIRLMSAEKFAAYLIVFESLVRTNISVCIYWIFEAIHEPIYAIPSEFFSSQEHLVLVLSVNFIGFMVGIANANADSYLHLLRETSRQLQLYSEWTLGKHILAQAVTDNNSLSLTRRERTVLFMDIRGFTRWSEAQPPEKVVEMLNEFYAAAEVCWENSDMIKVKFTGDEVMIVFQTMKSAVRTAQKLRSLTYSLLKSYELSAGIGIHAGPLVEGLLGSNKVKAYDIIGDTVNTAKRICDHAAGGSILISDYIYANLPIKPVVEIQRSIQVKGKMVALLVYPLVL